MPAPPASADPAPAFGWPAEALWAALSPRWPGLDIEVCARLDSTNTRLLERARARLRAGEPPQALGPSLLVAEQQTAGRGRHGRAWLSGPAAPAPDPGADPEAAPGPGAGAQAARAPVPAADPNPAPAVDPEVAPDPEATRQQALRRALTFSLGLSLPESALLGLAPAVGLALVQALHPALRLKWPNDLWLDGRKLGGVLIETLPAGPGWRHAVIGIGLNLQTPSGLPPDAAPATGLDALPADPADPASAAWARDARSVFARLVPPLLDTLDRLAREGWPALAAAYAARDGLRGQTVRVLDATGQERLRGRAAGLDGQAALLVHTAAGLQAIHSGEIVSVRPC